MTYRYKTKPFDHQHKEFTEHGADPIRGLFWEQGCGKTKPVLDSTAYLYEEKEIDGLIVVAPNGVHENWVTDEIEAHLPDRVAERVQSHVWYSTATKKHARSFEAALKHDGLAVMVMSYPAVWTPRGGKAWKEFLKTRRCLYVLDESHRVKTPGAKSSKRILGSKNAAPFRRVMTGTPVANSPFDLYNPLRFLQADIWHQYGIQNFAAFKTTFGIWETRTIKETGKKFPHCVAYKNLDLLNQHLTEVGSRLTKDEVLDLPPKVYSKRYFDLTRQQKSLYEDIKEECICAAAEGELTAALAIVKLLRFQQICCGYLPASDDDPTLCDIDGGNPRLELLWDTVKDIHHKCIIWARFRRDIELVSGLIHKGNMSRTMRDRSVVVDGTVTGPPRGAALKRFREDPNIQFLVANPAAIGMGVTLTEAKTVIYYSNSFNLTDRLQSEDRPHRISQDSKVQYIDLAAKGTVDLRIVESLQTKRGIAGVITGDNLLEWI